MTKNLVEDSIKITYDVKLFALNEIKISGIWGYGNYDITIFTEKEQIILINYNYLIEKWKIIINYIRNIKSHFKYDFLIYIFLLFNIYIIVMIKI
ncbi:MAG: hypothetical protein CXB60_11425 [Spiroplasma poulsonii]|nr:hypothetical protein [Spiroplasma poulsonii]